MFAPSKANPSLGCPVPELGFCITQFILTNNCCADTSGVLLNVNLVAEPLKLALPPPDPYE